MNFHIQMRNRRRLKSSKCRLRTDTLTHDKRSVKTGEALTDGGRELPCQRGLLRVPHARQQAAKINIERLMAGDVVATIDVAPCEQVGAMNSDDTPKAGERAFKLRYARLGQGFFAPGLHQRINAPIG